MSVYDELKTPWFAFSKNEVIHLAGANIYCHSLSLLNILVLALCTALQACVCIVFTINKMLSRGGHATVQTLIINPDGVLVCLFITELNSVAPRSRQGPRQQLQPWLSYLTHTHSLHWSCQINGCMGSPGVWLHSCRLRIGQGTLLRQHACPSSAVPVDASTFSLHL